MDDKGIILVKNELKSFRNFGLKLSINQMSNEFLPKCYFENELEQLQIPFYGRLNQRMDDTIDQLLPYPKVCEYAVRRLSRQLTRCNQLYDLLKLLLLTHNCLRSIPMGKLLLLESLSLIQLSNIRCKHRFEHYLINGLLKDYIQYLKRMCASCRIYGFCVGLYAEDEPQLYFYGAINLVQYCWPLFDKFKTMESILKQIYPFILDILVNIGRDAKDFIESIWELLERLSESNEPEQQLIWQSVTKQLLEIYHRADTVFENQLLRSEVGAPELGHLIPSLMDFHQDDLNQFMESDFKPQRLF